MPDLHFSSAIQRHVPCATIRVDDAATVREALIRAFEAGAPELERYLLDDQGALRHHVAIFVAGRQVRDRTGLSDPVEPNSRIDVMQALSGG